MMMRQMSKDYTIKVAATLLMLCCTVPSFAQMRIEDMDEDDWMAQRDTAVMSRRNMAKDTGNTNAMDYILDDYFKPEHESFATHWYDNVYLGVSGGMEQIVREDYVPGLTPLTQGGIMVGKLFSPKHSARLTLGGGAGFLKGTSQIYYRGSLNADYLFSLSTHFNGYNPTRRFEVSLVGGMGAGISKTQGMSAKLSAELRGGLQIKVYTGPFGSLAVEPYIGVATDAVDFSEQKNWRGYDLLYGLSLSYLFYTDDNLSRESRLRLLQHRLEGDRLIDRYSLSSWRTPWFFELSDGILNSSTMKGSDATGNGNSVQFSIGRWMSPVIGLRATIGSRISQWNKVKHAETEENYNSHFVYGKVDAMLNPFGFLRSFDWDNRFGGFLLAGAELGRMKKYLPGHDVYTTTTAAYSAGIHLWYRLSKDLHFFVEPTYSMAYYRMQGDNGGLVKSHDNIYGLNFGVTMLMRSARYREPDEYDKVQNYNYRHIRGFAVGVAGGLPLLQRRQVNYGNAGMFCYNGMIYGEYRFNHLHAVRGAVDLMHLEGRTGFIDAVAEVRSNMAVASLNYQLNLTNLLSGRFSKRAVNLELFAGPAVGTVVSGSRGEKNMFPGIDVGLKLSAPVWKGISVVAMPTFYVLANSQLPGTNTVGISDKLKIYQTLNIGVQCNADMFKRNKEKLRAKRIKSNLEWAEKQRKAIQEYETKRKARIAKRHK